MFAKLIWFVWVRCGVAWERAKQCVASSRPHQSNTMQNRWLGVGPLQWYWGDTGGARPRHYFLTGQSTTMYPLMIRLTKMSIIMRCCVVVALAAGDSVSTALNAVGCAVVCCVILRQLGIENYCGLSGHNTHALPPVHRVLQSWCQFLHWFHVSIL